MPGVASFVPFAHFCNLAPPVQPASSSRASDENAATLQAGINRFTIGYYFLA